MKPDFGLTSEDYARHRAGFSESLFERLASFGIGQAGQSVVDLGTGTGSLARGFARKGCEVVGVDPAEKMLREAAKLDAAVLVRVEYRVGRAEKTGLPDAAFDVVTAGQCWHWFDRKEAAEAAQLLKPGGRLVIAHFDWIPLQGNVVEATERLIEQHNPAWYLGGGSGIYPRWPKDLGEAHYGAIETFSYDRAVSYTPEAWRGRIRASAGVGASLTPDQVEAFDQDLARLLSSRFPGELLSVPHRLFAVLACRP